jgi:Copine
MGPSNQYEAALLNVGLVVEPYDSDRSFPVYGFGGIPRHMGQNSTNHCFPMNGNVANPELIGIDSIIRCYRETLPSISLSGPTYFGPLLKNFANYCRQFDG